MEDTFKASCQLLDRLAGIWKGEGRGQFPGVTSFSFRETLVFTRRDQKTMAYEQRTQKLYDGQTEYLQSHWENGFINILEDGRIQLSNIQIGGRNEILAGTVESLGETFRILFASKALNNDPRMISSARIFELQGDRLHCEMEMQTTKVERSMLHLTITLQRSM